MPQGSVNASNAILVSGTPLVDELEVKIATSMYPGRWVIKDTDDQSIQVAGAGALNVLGILDVKADKTRDTIYTAGDQARVLRGPIRVMAVLTDGQTVAKGEALILGASGKLVKAASITAAVPSGGTAVTSKAAQPTLTMAGSYSPGGTVVADADESAAPSGSDAWIRVICRI